MAKVPEPPAVGSAHQYLCDTNVFRGLAQGRYNQSHWYEFVAAVRNQGGNLWFSVITVYELLAHINQNEPDLFPVIRDSFQHMSRTCGECILPQPENELRTQFGGASEGLGHLHTFLSTVRSIARSISPMDLSRGLRDRIRKLNQMHQANERQWIRDVIVAVISQVNPNSLSELMAGRFGGIEDDAIRKKYLAFVGSQTMQDAIVGALVTRGGGSTPKNTAEFAAALVPFEAAVRMYQRIVRQVGESGYDPTKKQNDFEDLMILMHLRRMPLITQEDFKSRIGGIAQAANIITPADACSRYGVRL